MSETSEHVYEQLSEFIDGRLDDDQRTRVEAHLRNCKECWKRSKEMKQLRDAILATPIIDPPESLYENVLQQIERPQKRGFDFSVGWPAKALASACVVMLVVWVARDQFRPHQPVVMMMDSDKRLETNERKMNFEPVQVKTPQAPAPVLQSKPFPARQNEDLRLKQQIANMPPPKPLSQRTDVTTQARDIHGAASQNSFMNPNALKADRKLSYTSVDSLAKSPAAAASIESEAETTKEDAKDVQVSGELASRSRGVVAKDSPMSVTSSYAPQKVAEVQAVSEGDEVTAVRTAPASNPFSSGELREWRGTFSGIKQFRTLAIRSSGEWAALWKQHSGTQSSPPTVDFANFMIVGVYAGQKTAANAGVELIKTEEDYPPALIVHYRDIQPTSSGAKNVTTQPFHLWLIPKTTLPVKFKKQ
jgi:hypothetical protein